MKNVFGLFSLLALFCLWVTLCPVARAEFQVPALTGRVVDAGGVFTPEDRSRIEQAILKLEEATGGQMVVTTLPTLGGLPIEEAGIKLGDAWKIGHAGKDDGAILLFVVPERQMRLEIGRGWEGPVNDARAGDVIRALVPFFRAEKYADGAIYAVEKVQEFVTGNLITEENSLVSWDARQLTSQNIPQANQNSQQTETQGFNFLEFLAIGFLGLFMFFLHKIGWLKDSDGFFDSGSSGGSFSGGGGSFGGGGASGRW